MLFRREGMPNDWGSMELSTRQGERVRQANSLGLVHKLSQTLECEPSDIAQLREFVRVEENMTEREWLSSYVDLSERVDRCQGEEDLLGLAKAIVEDAEVSMGLNLDHWKIMELLDASSFWRVLLAG